MLFGWRSSRDVDARTVGLHSFEEPVYVAELWGNIN